MLFGLFSKKSKNNSDNAKDYFGNPKSGGYQSADKIFRMAAILIIVYIFYSSYQSDKTLLHGAAVPAEKSIADEAEAKYTEQEIQAKVEAAFLKMKRTPEFKKISDFIKMTEGKFTSSEVSLLESADGYIIYIPNDKLSELNDAKKFKSTSKDYDFEISVSKSSSENHLEVEGRDKNVSDSVKRQR
ncbi:MAG TPA: hypothetical protein DIV86_07460 [Alphaproteobacteria bacterium]|nr:hypothetical protein [Alphaproteobacteria bacterium]